MTPKPVGLRAPDEKTSLGFKDSSEKGHKTKGDYLFSLPPLGVNNHAS